ncbi:MAG: hypothetical protein PHT49_05435 [Desulfovibrionales bacterium]|nr:hypothetical protein [Desulfovibrionales bacterium]
MKQCTEIWGIFWGAVVAMAMIFGPIGCNPYSAAMYGIEAAKIAAPAGATLFGKKDPWEVHFKPNIDSKEAVIEAIGKPNYVVGIDENMEVLAYQTSVVTYAFAFKNGLYQDKCEFLTDNWKEREAKSKLRFVMIRTFPCYAEKDFRKAVFRVDSDPKGKIIQAIGKPDFTLQMNETMEVLIYDGEYGWVYAFALKDGLYQDSKSFYNQNLEGYIKTGRLRDEMIKLFPCFQKAAAR